MQEIKQQKISTLQPLQYLYSLLFSSDFVHANNHCQKEKVFYKLSTELLSFKKHPLICLNPIEKNYMFLKFKYWYKQSVKKWFQELLVRSRCALLLRRDNIPNFPHLTDKVRDSEQGLLFIITIISWSPESLYYINYLLYFTQQCYRITVLSLDDPF